MNLVAKEFVAAQDPADPGVLVLSSLAGAAVELTDALIVNPNDIRGVAEAIQVALTLPRAERATVISACSRRCARTTSTHGIAVSCAGSSRRHARGYARLSVGSH